MKTKNKLSCRTQSFIGTFNVRTIREQHERLELVDTFIRSGIKILGLQEHRIVNQEEIKVHGFKDGVKMVTSSVWRNSTGASTG